MDVLISIIVALSSSAAFVWAWHQQKRAQYHAMTHATAEFVAAAQDVLADDLIPEKTKEFLRSIAPDVDNRRLAKQLVIALAKGTPTMISETDFIPTELAAEQQVKIVKALFLFVMALSYSEPSKGRKLRDFVLSNKVTEHVATAGRMIDSFKPGTSHIPQAA
jgi:hypothetical protein